MTSPRPRSLGLAAAALLSPLLLGCSADPAEPESGSGGVTAAPAKIERIAELTGCKPEIRIEADELREGVCRTSRGRWIVTTFPREKFKETWLDAAAIYGGTYLVGPRWAIGGERALLDDLRTDVGGELRNLRDSPSPVPASS
ncbi:hypothetical protein [Streptomyces fructofermentans]|uniref:Lipoprotein n=1 Tax=Streptomyces fructofermentans TaxID=152141 RepID=A0A918NDF4_9ACTN|nr:hypothetical protein [Streptomyces fructofermentans]GGX59725.1 hypothetical protein GCM10010515_29770 [Streptomyces fructofermentans]